MKKAIVALAGTLSLLLASSAFAAKTAAVNVTGVSTGSSGNVIVKTDGTFVNPVNCTNSAYLIESTDPQLKNYLAILLTARASGSTVVLSISESVCINSGKNPKITNIEL